MKLSQADKARLLDISTRRRGQISDIVHEVSSGTGISCAEIYGRSRLGIISQARQVVMYLAAKRGLAVSKIASNLSRDRTTISHGIRVEKARRGEV